jgi:hypothetical protein
LREIVCLDAITHAAGFVAPSMGQLGGATLMMARPDLARMASQHKRPHGGTSGGKTGKPIEAGETRW